MGVKFKAGLRKAARWLIYLSAGALVMALLVVLFLMRHALYHRWVVFPREAAAWAAIRADRQPVTETNEWNEYHGILHSHSHFSHDCEVTFEHILKVMQETGRDFICLSDHCVDGAADFSLQWRGLHDGKLFIPGFEMKEGLMPFGVAAGVVLSNRTEASLLAQQIIQNGGLLFYAHPEEPRDWDRPELTGMEIYNIHADFKDKQISLTRLLPDVWLNSGRYPDQVVRLIFDRPTANLRRWDALNRTRHLTGIAGNDCHQNTGLRGFITPAGKLKIEDTSPKTLGEYELNFFTRWLMRLTCGPLQPGRRLFHAQLDPYERMVRYVTTHVLARDLTETSILESLKMGRAFVGFDMLADSTSFLWLAQNGPDRAVMGETRPFSPELQLRAVSPHHCQFTVIKNGEPVNQQQGRSLEYKPSGPGTYRVEAELRIRGEWVPWIYSNPIWLQ